MTIGELSRRTGVVIETIRYYERSGILPPAARTANGRRSYDSNDVRRLRMLRQARRLGFGMSEIREFMDLLDAPQKSCDRAASLARRQVAAIDLKIAQLATMRRILSAGATACPGTSADCCAVMATLTE